MIPLLGSWAFRHNEGWGNQLMQVFAGLALFGFGIYSVLQIFLMWYESGKGEKERKQIEREVENEHRRRGLGYRCAFCIRLSMSAAFALESWRYGQGVPSLVLFAIAVASWIGLNPEKKWME